MTNDFDFAAFNGALNKKTLSAWIEFFPDNAEWIEYKPTCRVNVPLLRSGA